ncbi:hypothetical protein [Lysinibacillus fusiformis]|uniref:Uncharacterized protein n=1 Tax=Lysinibacillus fusiformis TaxID=28031 RepID=A0A1H9MHY9_9BACI|nr:MULTISPECIES: hypothetical protein [Lysinibacillus]NOG26429.1 hypothetical protein [Lysinibacillus fusiformis]PCD84961.1 hypothetical protein CNQ87_11615 [Lysinibacillus fusiformis]QAS56049.1 hypothetical protein LSP_06470 [Lysinibacillus sphaericus]RDV34840.1 hypothetical protein C7B90_04830 [Lysinibacillus fusiformis]SCY62114.1 hypothetical protein SAMN02787081_03346 [Lysinibacillus fusiformis]
MLFILLFVIPVLGVLYFLNFTTFLKKLINGKNTYNQNVLGAILTFMLIFTIMYCFAGLH